jgi:hypothetical protein
MKLYVDDTRLCPDGWALASTYEEAVEVLAGGQVTHLDLDWNLGQGRDRTGLSILEWLEAAVGSRRVPLPEISVHTADRDARQTMLSLARRLGDVSKHRP